VRRIQVMQATITTVRCGKDKESNSSKSEQETVPKRQLGLLINGTACTSPNSLLFFLWCNFYCPAHSYPWLCCPSPFRSRLRCKRVEPWYEKRCNSSSARVAVTSSTCIVKLKYRPCSKDAALSLSVSLSLCLCLSLSVCLCLSLSVSVCLCLCLCLSFSLSLSRCVYEPFLSLSVRVWPHVCVCISPSVRKCGCSQLNHQQTLRFLPFERSFQKLYLRSVHRTISQQLPSVLRQGLMVLQQRVWLALNLSEVGELIAVRIAASSTPQPSIRLGCSFLEHVR
jgi:hypothetical protein